MLVKIARSLARLEGEKLRAGWRSLLGKASLAGTCGKEW